MYKIGSIADIISGLNTFHAKTLGVQEVKPENVKVQQNQSENVVKIQQNQSENVPESKTEHEVPSKKKKPKKKKPKSKPNPTRLEELKRKSNDDDVESEKPQKKKQKKEQLSEPDKNENCIAMKNKSETRNEREARTIFVGNVPLHTKKNAIKKFFSIYGPIETLRYRGVPLESVENQVPRGNPIEKGASVEKSIHPYRNCYIVFVNEEDAQKALEANGKVLQEHRLRVNMSMNSDPDPQKGIFIGNLPLKAGDDELWELFNDCGTIVSVRIVRDPHTHIGKGFGYVNFDSKDGVELALEMEDVRLSGLKLRISRCTIAAKSKKVTTVGKKVKQIPEGYSNAYPIRKTTTGKKVKRTPERNFNANPNRKTAKEAKKTGFQGSKFTDKKKKKKVNKSELKMKKMSKILTAQ